MRETGPIGKFKGFDYEDGRVVNVAYFSGYSFGDRLLEGVMFKATVNDNGSLSVEVCDSSKDYMRGLNGNKWIKEAYEYAAGNDVFSETENGGEDLCLISKDNQ